MSDLPFLGHVARPATEAGRDLMNRYEQFAHDHATARGLITPGDVGKIEREAGVIAVAECHNHAAQEEAEAIAAERARIAGEIDRMPDQGNHEFGWKAAVRRVIGPASLISEPDAEIARLRKIEEALERLLTEPTTDIRTTAARTLFDMAKRSRTQEVTVAAQQLRVLLPAIETQAVDRIARAALAAGDERE